MKKRLLFFLLIMSVGFWINTKAEVKRVILFTIDGLHWEAPGRLNMPIFNNLVRQGTYIQQSYVIIPHHPTVGEYSKFNSCSFPNPVLHEGTIFLSPENKMIQEVFSPQRQSAFIVNTPAYKSVGRGFSTLIMDETFSDDQVVDQAIEILKTQTPVFMRVHLQTPGQKGYEISQSASRNIFAFNSPYVKAIEHADKLLGQFIFFLKESGLWSETVLIVTSDHGQSKTGWHSLFDEDSWRTPLLFVGPVIAQGRELFYFEQTDLAPTIAGLLGEKSPNADGGAGMFVKAILKDQDTSGYHPKMYIKTIDQQIREYTFIKARMIIAAEKDNYFSNVVALLENGTFMEPFFHQDRIVEWYKAGSTARLIEINENVLKQMRKAFHKN